jgi:hypothetical protein
MQNMQYIFCACGVRLNTQQDGVNLGNMKAALQSVLNEHKYGPMKSALQNVLNEHKYGPMKSALQKRTA